MFSKIKIDKSFLLYFSIFLLFSCNTRGCESSACGYLNTNIDCGSHTGNYVMVSCFQCPEVQSPKTYEPDCTKKYEGVGLKVYGEGAGKYSNGEGIICAWEVSETHHDQTCLGHCVKIEEKREDKPKCLNNVSGCSHCDRICDGYRDDQDDCGKDHVAKTDEQPQACSTDVPHYNIKILYAVHTSVYDAGISGVNNFSSARNYINNYLHIARSALNDIFCGWARFNLYIATPFECKVGSGECDFDGVLHQPNFGSFSNPNDDMIKIRDVLNAERFNVDAFIGIFFTKDVLAAGVAAAAVAFPKGRFYDSSGPRCLNCTGMQNILLFDINNIKDTPVVIHELGHLLLDYTHPLAPVQAGANCHQWPGCIIDCVENWNTPSLCTEHFNPLTVQDWHGTNQFNLMQKDTTYLQSTYLLDDAQKSRFRGSQNLLLLQ